MRRRAALITRRALIAAVAGATPLLSGCVTESSPAPGPDEAEKTARNDCPSEPFTLLGTKEVRKSPQCVEYRYKTRRGIVFTVTSQIATGGLFGCYASVTSDYAPRVQDLYRSRCEDAISRSCRYDADRGYASVSSFDELQDIARAARAANDIYAGERAVNTASWCEDHPVIVFWVQWRDGADAEAVTIGKTDGYGITGSLSEQKLLDALQQGYAQAVADGKIPDRGELPEDLAASVRASQLTELVVRGHAIPFGLGADDGATFDDKTSNPYQRLYDGDRSAPMRWNKTVGAYEIALDLGEGEGYYDGSAGWHESYEPGSWLVEHVMDAAGGAYRVEGDDVVWQLGARGGRIAMRWSAQDGSSSTWRLDGWPFAKHKAAIPHDTVGYAQPPLTLDAFAEYFGFELDVSERLRRATLL